MSKKFKFGILFLVFVGIISVVFWSEQGESYSVETVVDSVWSEFMVQSSEIGEYENPSDGEPAIFIDVYDKNDIPRVEKYLQDSLSKNDLNKYEIVVFSNKGITY